MGQKQQKTKTIQYINTEFLLPVDNSINHNLDRVGISQEMNDFHGVLHNTNSHQLLPIVAAVHHKRVSQPLDNRALSLPETLHLVPSCSVRDVCSVLHSCHSNVISQSNVMNLHFSPAQITIYISYFR